MNILAPVYYLYKRRLNQQIQGKPIPKHIGIILDGNRRYATLRGIDFKSAYEHGAKKLEEVLRWSWNLGIEIVSVWVFSTENFSRSKDQVELIMQMAREKLLALKDSKDIHEKQVRVRVLGSRALLPAFVVEAIEEVEEATKHYDSRYLNILMAYGGRREIIEAVQKLAYKIKNNELSPEDINEETINQHLYTAGLPDPDLIIRTSGEERLSGFMMWQSAYAEFYFAEVFWPLFREIDLWRAIRSFQMRERRFGR